MKELQFPWQLCKRFLKYLNLDRTVTTIQHFSNFCSRFRNGFYTCCSTPWNERWNIFFALSNLWTKFTAVAYPDGSRFYFVFEYVFKLFTFLSWNCVSILFNSLLGYVPGLISIDFEYKLLKSFMIELHNFFVKILMVWKCRDWKFVMQLLLSVPTIRYAEHFKQLLYFIFRNKNNYLITRRSALLLVISDGCLRER